VARRSKGAACVPALRLLRASTRQRPDARARAPPPPPTHTHAHTDPERQRECAELLGPLPNERYAELVALGKLISDYVGEGEAVAAGDEGEGLDEDIGVAVEVRVLRCVCERGRCRAACVVHGRECESVPCVAACVARAPGSAVRRNTC
jgi:hypothetical protein